MQYPVMPGDRRSVVLLNRIPWPLAHLDPTCKPSFNLLCAVRAARIDDDDLVGPCDRADRRREMGGLVECDDGDRERWHAASVGRTAQKTNKGRPRLRCRPVRRRPARAPDYCCGLIPVFPVVDEDDAPAALTSVDWPSAVSTAADDVTPEAPVTGATCTVS